jgi:hypothetical protein
MVNVEAIRHASVIEVEETIALGQEVFERARDRLKGRPDRTIARAEKRGRRPACSPALIPILRRL